MDFYAIGRFLKMLFMYPLFGSGNGGSKPQQIQLIDLLKEQSCQNNLLLTNHITHLQGALEGNTCTLQEISRTCKEVSLTLQCIRAETKSDHDKYSEKLAHLEGRMGI